MYMDYEIIQDENHDSYVEQIKGFINTNTQTNSMNMFIEKIIKQPEEYQILCNALYWFIKGPTPIQQGGIASESSGTPVCNAESYEINQDEHCDKNKKKPSSRGHLTFHPDKNTSCEKAATEKYNELTDYCSKLSPALVPVESLPSVSEEPSSTEQKESKIGETFNPDRSTLESSGTQEEAPVSSSEPVEPAPTTEYYQNKIIETLEKLKSKKFITIPHKNKLLIDQSFKQSNYKHYLSFYIINQQYI